MESFDLGGAAKCLTESEGKGGVKQAAVSGRGSAAEVS